MGKTSLGIDENIEALLSYVIGWLTGIVLLVLEKDSKFVRFHAMQSTITFLGFTVLFIILSSLRFLLWLLYSFLGFTVLSIILSPLPRLVSLVGWIIWIIAIITWIVCMIKAYQGERFKLPIVGDLAEKYIR